MAGKGGGAWKVAYADFVTAMMAFFLVMWLCGQNQQVKSSVSDYFIDPFGASKVGPSKKPNRAGAMRESLDAGNLPQSESVNLGRGRNPYLSRGESSVATKLISDWVFTDKTANTYWREQVVRQREAARRSKEGGENAAAADRVAGQQLARQLKEEIGRGIPGQVNSLYQDLLFESLAGVNWSEVAEDLLAR